MIHLKKIIKEIESNISDFLNEAHKDVYPNDARFGLGAIDAYGAIKFKEFSRDTFSDQAHGILGNPTGRWRFRYMGGDIDWTDCPEAEQENIVNNYFSRKGWPVEEHFYNYDDYDPDVGGDIDESQHSYNTPYHKKLSDDDGLDLANLYFSIGQEDDETMNRNYCWIWDGNKIIAKKGGTHGSNFTHEIADRNFKGWYDVDKNAISIVFPDYIVRELGGRKPTEDDIPQQIYQKLINKFGKRKPRFVVFESVLLNESGLKGEWWFQDGQAIFADGDVGDVNHEASVIDSLRREVLDSLGVDTGNYDYAPDFNDVKEEIFKNIGDDLNNEELELWKEDEFGEVIISYLKRQGDKNIENKIYYIRGHDSKGKTLDAREYALVNWGWQRVKGNTIQTQTLTSKDLNNIVRGIWEAYGGELEDGEDPFFNIEVMATRSWYEAIPLSVLEKKEPSALNTYRSRYE